VNDVRRNPYAPGAAALEGPATPAPRPGIVRVAAWLLGAGHLSLTVLWPAMIDTSKPAVAAGKTAGEAGPDYYHVTLGFAVLATFLFGPFGLLAGAAKRRSWARTTLVLTLPLLLAFIALMVALSGAPGRRWLWPVLLALMGIELVGLVLLCTPRANRWYREA
jgi:hypothetical protein